MKLFTFISLFFYCLNSGSIHAFHIKSKKKKEDEKIFSYNPWSNNLPRLEEKPKKKNKEKSYLTIPYGKKNFLYKKLLAYHPSLITFDTFSPGLFKHKNYVLYLENIQFEKKKMYHITKKLAKYIAKLKEEASENNSFLVFDLEKIAKRKFSPKRKIIFIPEESPLD